MIKKIICPTDFSSVANNAVEYAARLCQALNAELCLLHIESIPTLGPLISAGATLEKNMEGSTEALRELCVEVASTFNIPCTYELKVSGSSLGSSVNKHAGEESLIVCGTSGVDSIYDYFFGTNTYQVAKHAEVPVIVVPANTVFRDLKKMVFAFSYDETTPTFFTYLKDFIEAFHMQLCFLHVSDTYINLSGYKSEVGPDIFEVRKAEIAFELGKNANTEFKQIYSEDIPGSLHHYLLESEADILAMTLHNQDFLAFLRRHSLVRELTETANYPILILPV
jgi:nucleotide-binding universal stress UspA family protein